MSDQAVEILPRPAAEQAISVKELLRRGGDQGVVAGRSSLSVASDLLLCERVEVPAFTAACYYAPFQKYAIDASLDLWPEGFNQCHPLVVTDLRGVKRGGMFLVLHLADGSYLALLPVVTERTMAWFRGDEEGLILEASHWGTEAGPNENIPVLGWARDRNVYRACEAVWRLVLGHSQGLSPAKLRSEKMYPEVLNYLGWCSWEEYKGHIGGDLLAEVAKEIDLNPAPVRWMLVDDGHLDVGPNTLFEADGQNGEVPLHEADLKLWSLEVNPRRFPDGWRPLMEAVRGTKLRWLGVWLNFNGYWGGISSPNGLNGLNDVMMEVRPGVLQPRPDAESARKFYSQLVETQRLAGFDFVKVDNQARNVTFYRDRVPNAVEATMSNHRALEEAVERHMEAMINCMAHNNLCAFSTRHSQITRCSEDYKKGDLWRAKHHLSNSFANMLWLGQTVWGDHDMFHSSDAVAGELMARSKAISGGPIYLSDHPGNFRLDLIRPLAFEDGRLLRPLAPAAPLPESVFLDTYAGAQAFRVIAPLPHKCAAVAAYNLTVPEKPVDGFLRADDYRWADAMMQGPEAGERPLPPEGLVAFDIKRRLVRRLSDSVLRFELEKFGDEFFILSPIRLGWALIGREDKYLPPVGVAELEVDSTEMRLHLPESGPILIWRADDAPCACDAGPMESLGGGLWRVPLPVKTGPAAIRIRLS